MAKNEGLSERIRNRRIELGLSQAQLSRDTGIAAPQLSRYESGANEPRPDITAKIAQALKVNLNWLITGNGEEEKNSYVTAHADVRGSKPWSTLTISLPLESIQKLQEIGEFQGLSMAGTATNLIQTNIDFKHEEIQSLKKPNDPHISISSYTQHELKEALTDLLSEPTNQALFASLLKNIHSTSKITEMLTEDEVASFDKIYFAKHGEEPKDRSTYFTELAEYLKNKRK